MVTKSKIINTILKITAFALIVALSVTMVLKVIELAESPVFDVLWNVVDIGETDYTQTQEYWSYMHYIDHCLFELQERLAGRVSPDAYEQIQELYYSNQWQIREGLLDEYMGSEETARLIEIDLENNYSETIQNNVSNLFLSVQWEIEQKLREFGVPELPEGGYEHDVKWNFFTTEYAPEIAAETAKMAQQITENYAQDFSNQITEEMLYAAFLAEYEEEIDSIIDGYATSVEILVGDINTIEGLLYFMVVGDAIYTNTDLSYDELMEKSGDWRNINPRNFPPPPLLPYSYGYHVDLWQNYNNDDEGGDAKPRVERYAFALSDELFAERARVLMEVNDEIRDYVIFGAIWLGLYLLCAIYLICAAGKRPGEKGAKTYLVDKVFGEVVFGLAAGLVALGFVWGYLYLFYFGTHALLEYVFIGGLALIFAAIYALFGVVVRQAKNRRFIKSLLTYKILWLIWKVFSALGRSVKRVGQSIKSLFSRQNPLRKMTLIVLGLGLLTMIPFVGFVTIPCIIVLLSKYVRNFVLIRRGAAAVRSGSYSEKIDIPGNSEFAMLADDINGIAAGLGEEVERRLKSERLKTELIVNVSHDIRTPLTSLITYADLLKNEETDNENVKKYAEIISQKSDRLKILTDDLFESAKAASGNVPVELGNVDVGSLLIQALAEFDDKIKKSNLEFKLNIPSENEQKIVAYADGGLLWRVVENLIANALKYSLEKSRVYIDVSESGDSVFIEVKNISKVELNISEDEFAERFKRGDLSRSSEGSGLGLDIASSLMRCQNGELTIKTDGDLFKVCARVPRG